MATMTMTTTIEHTVEETTQKVKNATIQPLKRVLHWNELPAWMKLEPHIRYGYRRELNSFNECFSSLFYTHNEFVNVWSHLFPAMLYLAFLLSADYSLLHSGIEPTKMDIAILQLYIIGTGGCLFMSATYHCSCAHSQHVARSFLKLDYLGVIISITVTDIGFAYFGLYGEYFLQMIYISLDLAFAAAVFHNLRSPHADGSGAALTRVLLNAGLVASGTLPAIHKFLTHGVDGLAMFPMWHTTWTVIFFAAGAAVYLSRFPEKYYPKTFDIWGSSHQSWHLLSMSAQVFFLFGLGDAMVRQHQQHI